MPHGIRRWVLGLMATGLTTLTLTAADQEAFLLKLGAVKVDGDLFEWNAAVTVPVRFASCIAQRRASHTWSGPADFGLELFCGWNDDGLGLAGLVSDDDVRNNRPPKDPHCCEEDCVEIFFDGRTGNFMTPPYTKGASHMLLRPPVGGKGPVMQFHAGMPEDIRLAGKLVPGGWTFEIDEVDPHRDGFERRNTNSGR